MLRFASSLIPALAAIGLAAGAARAEIVIAVAGPMSSQYAVFGEQLRRGAEQAVADLNRRGGVLGQTVILQVRDDICDPAQAVAVASELVNAGIVFVDGHFCSGSSIPASQVYHENGVLQISPASTNPRLTEQGFDNVFRVSGRDDQQGAIAAAHVVERRLGSRIAIITDGSGYGRTLAAGFRAELKRRGVQVSLDREIAVGQTDFAALIRRMRRSRIDLVYFGGFHPEAARLIRQAHKRGLEIKLVSGDALVTDRYRKLAGPAAEGTLLTFAPDPRRSRAAASVVRAFNAQGFDPQGYTLYSYGAVQVWAQAVNAAATTALDPVVERLRTGRFDTVLGRIRFDAKGDASGPGYVLYKWRDGELVQLPRRVRSEARAFVPGASDSSRLGP